MNALDFLGSANSDCILWKAARRWNEIERDGSRLVERRSKTKRRGGKMAAGRKASQTESSKEIKTGVDQA